MSKCSRTYNMSSTFWIQHRDAFQDHSGKVSSRQATSYIVSMLGIPNAYCSTEYTDNFSYDFEMPSVNKGLPQRTYLKKACEPSTTSEAKSKYSEG